MACWRSAFWPLTPRGAAALTRCAAPARRSAERRPGSSSRQRMATEPGGLKAKEGLIAMRVGGPQEVKNHEYRVAITPAGVHELVRSGHEVVIEAGAGAGSSIPDEDFTSAGAKILPSADDVWQAGDLILKVKEPVAEEYDRMRPGQVLFTY